MEVEIEVKFLRVSVDDVVRKLRELGAKEVAPNRVMTRNNFDFADKSLSDKVGWVRLRQENGVSKLAYKQQNQASVDGMLEVEFEVGDYDAAKQFLESIGLISKSYQESKRWSWRIDGVEVEIDEWPWCEPCVEIEGASEEMVREVANKLGFRWDDAVFGAADAVYVDAYDITDKDFLAVDRITFDLKPPKVWKKKS